MPRARLAGVLAMQRIAGLQDAYDGLPLSLPMRSAIYAYASLA